MRTPAAARGAARRALARARADSAPAGRGVPLALAAAAPRQAAGLRGRRTAARPCAPGVHGRRGCVRGGWAPWGRGAQARALTRAAQVLGDPEKRAAFDDLGRGDGQQAKFHTFWEWQMYGDKTQSNDFYRGEPLVSKLTAALWPRRVTGDAIWLVEFYAPWCSACGSFVPIFKKIAQALEHDAVEVPCPLPPPRAPRPSPHAPLPAAAPVSPSGGAAPALQRPGVCGRVRVGR